MCAIDWKRAKMLRDGGVFGTGWKPVLLDLGILANASMGTIG